jgi:hypothetical protein
MNWDIPRIQTVYLKTSPIGWRLSLVDNSWYLTWVSFVRSAGFGAVPCRAGEAKSTEEDYSEEDSAGKRKRSGFIVPHSLSKQGEVRGGGDWSFLGSGDHSPLHTVSTMPWSSFQALGFVDWFFGYLSHRPFFGKKQVDYIVFRFCSGSLVLQNTLFPIASNSN